MPQIGTQELCPRGHVSSEADYCSECGARIGLAAHSAEATSPNLPSSSLPSGITCPDCATPREGDAVIFCEVCGFNFKTGARGEIPGLAEPPRMPTDEVLLTPADSSQPHVEIDSPETLLPQTRENEVVDGGVATAWSIAVEVDPSLGKEESPAAPADFVAFTVPLSKPATLLGRADKARGIFPDIALTHDDAVSRRHALLLLDAETGQLSLRDIGASNGTRLNGTDLASMTDQPLKDGDQITLGHWSRLRVLRG